MRIENVTDKITLYNCDCMEYMKNIPDKYFDLAICDPPYRDNKDNQPTKDMRLNGGMKQWVDKPDDYYFKELFRISKNQIIWGANNFNLPNYKGFVVWEKLTISDTFTMSMAEIAYISEGLGTVSKIFKCAPQGTKEDPRIHPTQKPVKLYEWLLKNYAKQTDKILDTHFGSCSIGIACHNFGCVLDACEIDEEYFDKAYNRLKTHVRQLDLFK